MRVIINTPLWTKFTVIQRTTNLLPIKYVVELWFLSTITKIVTNPIDVTGKVVISRANKKFINQK